MNNLKNENNINGNTPDQGGPYEFSVAKNNDLIQDYSENQANTIVDKPLLPMSKSFNFDDEESISEEIKKKSNLLFEEKQVSAFKLYIHLSETYEILLMILGTIAALGAGVAAPLMCYFFGDMYGK